MRRRAALAALAAFACVAGSASPGLAQTGPRGLPQAAAHLAPLQSPAELGAPSMLREHTPAPNRYAAKVAILRSNVTFAAALTKSLARDGTGLPGTSLRTACDGFASVGQCLATIHAAKELATPGAFDLLRGTMLDGDGASLVAAIRAINPNVDAKKIGAAADHKARANCALVAASGY